jgi:hypothetical protein
MGLICLLSITDLGSNGPPCLVVCMVRPSPSHPLSPSINHLLGDDDSGNCTDPLVHYRYRFAFVPAADLGMHPRSLLFAGPGFPHSLLLLVSFPVGALIETATGHLQCRIPPPILHPRRLFARVATPCDSPTVRESVVPTYFRMLHTVSMHLSLLIYHSQYSSSVRTNICRGTASDAEQGNRLHFLAWCFQAVMFLHNARQL